MADQHLLVRSKYPGNGHKAVHVKGVGGLLCKGGPDRRFWHFWWGPLTDTTCQGCRKALERMSPNSEWPWTEA